MSAQSTAVSTADLLQRMSKPVIDGIRRDYPNAAKREYYARNRSERFSRRMSRA